jgi:hypothetical protein
MPTPTPAHPETDPLDLAAWLQAQQRLWATCWPDPARPHQAPWPFAPAARAAAVGHTLHRAAGRAVHHAAGHAAQPQGWAALAAMPLRTEAWAEGWALAQAAARQAVALQTQWLTGLAVLAEDAGRVRKADTLSRQVDTEAALMQQALALLASQASATAQLAENVQVNIAWWLARQAGAGR